MNVKIEKAFFEKSQDSEVWEYLLRVEHERDRESAVTPSWNGTICVDYSKLLSTIAKLNFCASRKLLNDVGMRYRQDLETIRDYIGAGRLVCR